jgi:hypothetical protein
MHYADARESIRSGDLLVWTHRSWGSWYDIQIQAVRIFTESEYSHVGVAWAIGGRVLVLEAVGAGVRIFPLSRLLPAYWVSIGRWNADAEAFALAHMGERYSKLEAILGFFRALRARPNGSWQCAKFAWLVLAHAGVRLGLTLTPSSLVQEALVQDHKLELLQA